MLLLIIKIKKKIETPPAFFVFQALYLDHEIPSF